VDLVDVTYVDIGYVLYGYSLKVREREGLLA
jgi:hypothetical protein